MDRRAARLLGVAAVLAAALLCCAPSAMAVQRIGLSAGTFRFPLNPGQTATGTVIVSNDGTEKMRVLVYAGDQQVDQKGGVSYSVPSQTELASLTNPSSWMRIFMPGKSHSLGNIPYIDMTPGQKARIRFAVVVPAGVAPGDHNVILFFEMAPPQNPLQQSGARVGGRLGSRITLRVKGDLFEKLAIGPFVVPAFVIGDKVPFQYLSQNQGNIDERITSTVSLMDRNDQSVATTEPITASLVFAQSNQETSGVVGPAGTLLFGPYTMRADVVPVSDAGVPVDQGKNAVTKTRTVWIFPMWAVIAAVVLVVLLVVWVIWLLARGSARRQLERQQRAAQPPAASPTPAPAPMPTRPSYVDSPPPAATPTDAETDTPGSDEWADGGS